MMVTAAERLALLEERDRNHAADLANMKEKLEELENLLRTVHQQLDSAQGESRQLRLSIETLSRSVEGIVKLVNQASGGKMLAGWIFGGMILVEGLITAVKAAIEMFRWKF